MAEEFGVKSEEIVERAKSSWILEKYQLVSSIDEQGNPIPDPAGDDVPWMIASSYYDERDRAVSTLAFHERKYPEDKQRVVRIEVRHYVEEVPAEELQKWHDLAAKGDAEKAARNQQ